MTALKLSIGCAPESVAAVDEEGRGAAGAQLLASAMSASMRALHCAAVERRLPLGHVEAELLRVLLEVGALRAPAGWRRACRASPRTCPARRPRWPRRRRAGASGWKGSGFCFITTRTLLPYSFSSCSQRGVRAAAERALVVGELDDGHLRVRRALGGALERHADAVDAVTRALRLVLRGGRLVFVDAVARTIALVLRSPDCRGRIRPRAPPPAELELFLYS